MLLEKAGWSMRSPAKSIAEWSKQKSRIKERRICFMMMMDFRGDLGHYKVFLIRKLKSESSGFAFHNVTGVSKYRADFARVIQESERTPAILTMVPKITGTAGACPVLSDRVINFRASLHSEN
jgi:hypothetical protein